MPLSQVERLKKIKIKDRSLLVLRNCNCESDLELREESYFDLKVGIDTRRKMRSEFYLDLEVRRN